jgi:hypothetical protein
MPAAAAAYLNPAGETFWRKTERIARVDLVAAGRRTRAR